GFRPGAGDQGRNGEGGGDLGDAVLRAAGDDRGKGGGFPLRYVCVRCDALSCAGRKAAVRRAIDGDAGFAGGEAEGAAAEGGGARCFSADVPGGGSCDGL